jgi:hypothetical protein
MWGQEIGKMKAIRTRYLPCTDTKGSRILASDGERNQIVIGYPHGLSSDEGHELAAYLLMHKMGWGNELNGGCFQNDMYWTMLPVVGRGTKPAYADFLTRPNIIAEYGVTVNDEGKAA